MATHGPTLEAIITATKTMTAPSPLSVPNKAQLIIDVETAVKAEFNSQGFLDAEASFVATIDDPAAAGPDPIVLWMDYEEPTGTPYRARIPMFSGQLLLAGADQF